MLMLLCLCLCYAYACAYALARTGLRSCALHLSKRKHPTYQCKYAYLQLVIVLNKLCSLRISVHVESHKFVTSSPAYGWELIAWFTWLFRTTSIKDIKMLFSILSFSLNASYDIFVVSGWTKFGTKLTAKFNKTIPNLFSSKQLKYYNASDQISVYLRPLWNILPKTKIAFGEKRKPVKRYYNKSWKVVTV